MYNVVPRVPACSFSPAAFTSDITQSGGKKNLPEDEVRKKNTVELYQVKKIKPLNDELPVDPPVAVTETRRERC